MGASTAKVYGTDKGTSNIYIENPYDGKNKRVWAGTFGGEVDQQSTKFYCIDIQHPLAVYSASQPHTYTDNGNTPSQITYILNNYYPFKSLPYSGSLSETSEAAAVQLAIWHYADGLDENTISITTLKNRAKQIIADADGNAGSTLPAATLVIEPMNQSVASGDLAYFVVKAYDMNGYPVNGVIASLSTSSGTLSTTSVVTGADGSSSTFTLEQGSEITAFVTATASVMIPHGTKYVHSISPDDYQKIVMAKPAYAPKSVTANVTWAAGSQLCAIDDNGIEHNVGGLTLTTLANGDIKVTLVYSKDFNDNTYGDNAVNWPGDNHKFKHLVTSDMATFSFTNGNGAEVLRFDMDYFSESSAYPSGYGTTGITGKDGNLITGNAAWVLDYSSSLTKNFNDFGYILTANSPETDDNYSANPSYPNWIYEMIYEVTISKNAFGSSGFGDVAIVNMHNSPHKLDMDDNVNPYYCEEECENTIGNFIWHDSNVNGIQDDGPNSGIEGVEVELYENGNVIATTLTDASGYYEFTGLLNGTYEVKVASSNFTASGVLTSTGPNMMWNASPKNKTVDTEDSDANKDEKVTVVLDCNDDDTIDFGFFKSCVSVTKTGPTEPAAAGDVITFHIEVENCGDATLGGGVDLTDPLLGFTTNFALAQGEIKTFDKTYTVTQEDCDRGFVENTVTVVGHPKDSYDTYYPNITDDDKAVVTVDCGVCTSMIGDFVWHDTNVNGIQDQDEPGIENVLVQLYKDGNVVATTLTNASGYYEFDELENVTYQVKVADSNWETGGVFASTGANMMWNASPKNKGTNDAKDSDANKGEKVIVTVNCEVNNTIDFGFFKSCVTVTKTGPTQAAKPGDVITFHIVVENCGDATLGGGVDLTDPLLNWSVNFSLAKGETKTFDKTYTVKQTDCDNGEVVNNITAVGHPKDIYNQYYPNVTDNDTWTVPVDCGQCSNFLGDFVWHDSNVNGIQDDGELGIEAVVVQLLSGTTVVATATTDENGYYEFVGFDDGDYTVKVANSNFNSGGVLYQWYSSPKDAAADDIDSDAEITSHSVNVSFLCEENPDVDFGFFKTCVSLTKTGAESVDAGETITYHFVLENCGDIVLHGGAQVYDELINPNGDHKIWDGIVQPHTSVSFDRTYTTSVEDCGELVNTAHVIGHPYMQGRTFANVTDSDTWTTNVICGEVCVESWTGTLGDNETLCEYEPQTITVNGSIELTPNPSRAKLVTTWQIIYPNGTEVDNTLHSTAVWIDGSTSFTIEGMWPGISPDDTEVRVRFTASIFDCDDNQLSYAITKDIYWTPEVCPPPPHEDVDIEIHKSSSTLYPVDGEQITFTITAKNNGPAEATGVIVTDILPEGFDYISDNPSQGTYNSLSGEWNIGTLANGATATLTITVKVDVEDVNSATFDLGIASDYNLFVLYDLNQPSADTQGKVAVGRDANLANYSIGDMLPNYNEDALIVGRYLVYTSGHVFGNIVYGDTTNLPIYATSLTGTLRKDNPINFSAAKTYLENLSTQLGGYTSQGTTEYKWSGVVMSGTDPFLNVFDVDGTQLSVSTWAEISVPNGSVVLVNISGTNISWSGGLDVKGTAYGNVLYNFYEAETLEIQGIEIRGSVLAPFAHVQFNSGVQEGQMICKSLSGPGQFNYNMFVGNIPSQSDLTNIASLTYVIETDTDATNNNSSVTVHINGEETTGDGSAAGDDGSYWQQVNSFLTGEIVYSLVNDNNGNVLAGTWGGKIYRSADGENWQRINNNMYTGFIWTIAVNEAGYIYAGTEQGIFMSIDNGATFVLSGLQGKDVRSIAIDSHGNLYAGAWSHGIFKSEDNGATWSEVNNGLTNLSINSLVVNSKDEIFAAAFGAGIFKSSDLGTNWFKLTVGYDFVWILGITSTDMLFAGTYGDGLYRSGDDGNQWNKVNQGLNAYYIYAISVDVNDKVYVSSWASGVFVSTDEVSSSFQTLGLGGIGVSSIVINPESNTLYAGTSDGTIYKKVSASITDTDDTVLDVPTEFELSQNYPNPFNPSTKIQFSIPAAGKYAMKIYNILGQEVAELLNEQMNPGKYTFDFNARGLASGIYFYRLIGDNKVNITKKMILLR